MTVSVLKHMVWLMNMTVTVLNHSGLWHEYDRDCFKMVYLISMTVTALRKVAIEQWYDL